MAKSAVKPMTKSAIYEALSKTTDKPKTEIKAVLEALEKLVIHQLGKKGPGVITLPGMVKLTAVKKPASKGGKEIPNPFKPGETIITKPKPASVKVRARALKNFADALK